MCAGAGAAAALKCSSASSQNQSCTRLRASWHDVDVALHQHAHMPAIQPKYANAGRTLQLKFD